MRLDLRTARRSPSATLLVALLADTRISSGLFSIPSNKRRTATHESSANRCRHRRPRSPRARRGGCGRNELGHAGASTYIRNVTPQELSAAGSAAPYGTWTLQIKRHGLSLDAKGQGLVPERASWAGAKVTVSDTPGSISIFCGSSVKGAYTWRQSGSTLGLKLVKDSCKDRAGVLAGSWRQTG